MPKIFIFAFISSIFLINCTEKPKDTNIDQLTIGKYFFITVHFYKQG
jgi:hypothetical protein